MPITVKTKQMRSGGNYPAVVLRDISGVDLGQAVLRSGQRPVCLHSFGPCIGLLPRQFRQAYK